jgi:pyrimidine-specific ribonucleoside hydrolase
MSEKSLNRRELLIAAAALAGFTTSTSFTRRRQDVVSPARIPLVHITDLYHPPQDPDDHFDLATVVALEEYDLRGVVLDATERFLRPAPVGADIQRDPGYVPVIQLEHLLDRSIPVAAGPHHRLEESSSVKTSEAPSHQAGVQLLLDILENSRDKVVVSVVGSARVIGYALRRNPGLLRTKIRSILLNAGSTAGPKREWNVGLDPEAYKALWRSGLPICWYPCATESGAFHPDHERGTFWKTTHAQLLRDIPPSLRAWFAYALRDDRRGDIIEVLSEEPQPDAWKSLLSQERNLWATASLVMGAGRVLARNKEGWRFVPARSVRNEDVWNWRLDPISATVDESAIVDWKLAHEGGNASLFWRERRPDFGGAMAEALGNLLGSISVKNG